MFELRHRTAYSARVMRLLKLTNSDDLRVDVPPAELPHNLAAARFQELTGEPCEAIARVIWPSPALPDIVDGWIKRYEPDIVMFGINGYWYIYRSVPLQVQRKFGRLGRPLARAGFKAGRIPWITRTGAFHAVRWLGLNTVGGAHYFEIDQVLDVVEPSLRRILVREDLPVIVRGALWHWESDLPQEHAMHVRLVELSERLRVRYLGRDPFAPDEAMPKFTDSDRLHTNREGRLWVADCEAQALAEEWRARRSAAAR